MGAVAGAWHRGARQRTGSCSAGASSTLHTSACHAAMERPQPALLRRGAWHPGCLLFVLVNRGMHVVVGPAGVVATTDAEEACKGVDVAVMVGGFPRKVRPSGHVLKACECCCWLARAVASSGVARMDCRVPPLPCLVVSSAGSRSALLPHTPLLPCALKGMQPGRAWRAKFHAVQGRHHMLHCRAHHTAAAACPVRRRAWSGRM